MSMFMVILRAPASSVAAVKAQKGLGAVKGEMEKWILDRPTIVGCGALGGAVSVDPSGSRPAANDVTGYCVVRAANVDAAAALFTPDFPHFQFAASTIDVMPHIPMVSE